MSIKDESNMKNIPAFPLSISDGAYSINQGMTLRDYFAGQVLASVAADLIKAMSTSEKTWIGEAADELETDSDTYIADCCYDMADKMIEARGLEQ